MGCSFSGQESEMIEPILQLELDLISWNRKVAAEMASRESGTWQTSGSEIEGKVTKFLMKTFSYCGKFYMMTIAYTSTG